MTRVELHEKLWPLKALAKYQLRTDVWSGDCVKRVHRVVWFRALQPVAKMRKLQPFPARTLQVGRVVKAAVRDYKTKVVTKKESAPFLRLGVAKAVLVKRRPNTP